MPRPLDRDRELASIAHQLAGLRVQVSLLRLGLTLERRYDRNQPRWPAGQREGGRWSGGGGGAGKPGRGGRLLRTDTVDADGNAIASAINQGDRDYDRDERHVVLAPDGTSTVFETKDRTQTIRDGETGEILSRSTWGPNGPEPDAVVQDVALRPELSPRTFGSPLDPTIIPGLALYNSLAEQPRSTADVLAIGFSANAYERNEAIGKLDWSGYVGQDAVNAACPRYPDVQAITDDAYERTKRLGEGANPADFGTRVHWRVKDRVNAEDNLDFRSEVSLLKSSETDVRYGTTGSIRVDVLERTKGDQICVYDIKTGRRGLSVPRATEIFETVYSRYPSARGIMIIEVRPGQ